MPDYSKKIKFFIGHSVYLITDTEQLERLVTGINIRPDSISYDLSQGINYSTHFDFEISEDRDLIMRASE